MISTLGFGSGISVNATGTNVRFNGEPRAGVKLKNRGTDPVYIVINRVITGAASLLGTVGDYPDTNFTTSNTPALTAAQAIAIGYRLNSGEEVKFGGRSSINDGPKIHRLAIICSSGETATVTGGQTDLT